jgi:hypothetical protein
MAEIVAEPQVVEDARHDGVEHVVDRLRLSVERWHGREDQRPGPRRFSRCTALSGVSRGTTISVRRSFSITSAARVSSVSEIPCATRAAVPIEQGTIAIACQPALPLANGAL